VAHLKKWAKDALEPIGDFECNYCDFRDVCYPQLTLTGIVEAGGMTEEQAMESLYAAGKLRRPADNQDEIDAFMAMPDY
jgi:predicted RecB family nuclease